MISEQVDARNAPIGRATVAPPVTPRNTEAQLLQIDLDIWRGLGAFVADYLEGDDASEVSRARAAHAIRAVLAVTGQPEKGITL